MPQPTVRRHSRRSSGGERVFADDIGRLWSASHTKGPDHGAIVFACISDSRQPVRAIEVETDFHIADVADEQLRTWLREAPRIGRLT
jgi:hypothetical protein